MRIVISQKIGLKLAQRHQVTESDIIECFSNRESAFVEDIREEHRTDPATQWFISENDRGVRLKIMFVFSDGKVFIKSAYKPTQACERLYNKLLKSVR